MRSRRHHGRTGDVMSEPRLFPPHGGRTRRTGSCGNGLTYQQACAFDVGGCAIRLALTSTRAAIVFLAMRR